MIAINKVCDWNEIVDNYPNMWAFIDLDNTKMVNNFITKCFVFYLCSFEEKSQYIVELRKQGKHFDCIRTTFSAPNTGFII